MHNNLIMSNGKRPLEDTNPRLSKRQRVNPSDQKLADIISNSQCTQSAPCLKCGQLLSPEQVTLTTCNHTFHIECLREWLENNSGCYYCENIDTIEQVGYHCVSFALYPSYEPDQYFTHVQPYIHKK